MPRMLTRLGDPVMASRASAKSLFAMDEVHDQPGVGRGMTDLAG